MKTLIKTSNTITFYAYSALSIAHIGVHEAGLLNTRHTLMGSDLMLGMFAFVLCLAFLFALNKKAKTTWR
jgi:hypothetical protein